MSYRIVKNKIIHNCPICAIDLENSLNEAGHNDTCPKCGISFVVPGEKELKEIEAKKRLEAQKKVEERLEEQQRAKNEASEQEARRSAEEARREAEIIRQANATKAGSHLSVPSYGALRAVGTLFIVSGILSIIIGFIGFLYVINVQDKLGVEAIEILAAGLMYGIVAIGMGQALYALRDMAINSFHSANSLRQLIQRKE